MPELDIRGLTQFTTLDYPGKLACVLFCGGCNLRCGYCHNPYLVLEPESQPRLPESEVLEFLRRRQGKLDAVVISGGEPTMRKALVEFAVAVKGLGFLIRIDTNGSNPKVIEACHRAARLDALGIDYKAPAARYQEVAVSISPALARNVRQVIEYALAHGIELEVRTTVHRSLLSPDDLRGMRAELDEMGVGNWYLQQFHPVETIDEGLTSTATYADEELVDLAKELGNTRVRGVG